MPRIEKRMLDQGAESADAAFRRAAGLIEKGRIADAKIALNAALAANPDHGAARQTLAALLIEARAFGEAETTLIEGLARDANNSNFAIVLARLKLERGDQAGALELLAAHRAAGATNPQYRAFHAALLRRAGRHAEAADEYQAALRQAPGIGAWWVGLALSHEANEREAEALHAFRQARASGALNAELADLVERKLRGTP
jgi:MSHA biogenesis protein MshN